MASAAPDPGGLRSDRPLRRSFTPAQKAEHVAAYEVACETNQGGAYLRSEGLFSSQISEWRKLRDAGVLAGKQPGERVVKPSVDQAEIARLRRDLDRAQRRLATTETALTIMGKHMRSWSRSPRARIPTTGAGSVDGHLHRAHPGTG